MRGRFGVVVKRRGSVLFLGPKRSVVGKGLAAFLVNLNSGEV